MAVFAYLLPPATGLISYLKGSSPRARRHGLQSVGFGLLWPVALYVGAALSNVAAQIAFALGLVTWIGLLVVTAAGRDAHLPGTGRWLERVAETGPGETTG